jgi:hypothetical protein
MAVIISCIDSCIESPRSISQRLCGSACNAISVQVLTVTFSLVGFLWCLYCLETFSPIEVVGRDPSVKAVQQGVLEHMMDKFYMWKRDMNR